MKKIILFCLFLFLFVPIGTYCNVPSEIQLIYINGSNNNDKKMRKWFFNGINKMHMYLVKEFNNSDFIGKNLLEEKSVKISETPEAYFWGDKSNNELNYINSDLNTSKFFSPKIAQSLRVLFAHYIHDAIWVSHYYNMHPIIEDLHKRILRDYKKGKSVILMGYSAGAFVSYEYLFNKLPYINTDDYFTHISVSNDFLNYVKANKTNNTCIDALMEAKLTVYGVDGGIIPMTDFENSYNQYSKLNEYTSKYCTPNGSVKGIINFASPLSLFYSDIPNPDYPLNYYNQLLYKYLIENNMFWLTVNYADDPMSYTVKNDFSYSDLYDKLNISIKPKKGFIYADSDIKSGRTVIFAHTSYWATAKKFSKFVVKAYEKGYKYYNENDL